MVKLIMLKLASTPDSDHVEFGEQSVVFYFWVGLCGDIGHWHLWRDVISAPHEDIVAVKIDSKLSPHRISILNNFNCLQASKHFLLNWCMIRCGKLQPKRQIKQIRLP